MKGSITLSAIVGAITLAIPTVVAATPSPAAVQEQPMQSPQTTVRTAPADALSPGKFGSLALPVSRSKAGKRGYVYRNGNCNRWETYGATYTQIKHGKIIALNIWHGRTTKGLSPGDSVKKMKRLYPTTRRTATHLIHYAPGGWRVYSAKNKAGWLDYYVPFGNQLAEPSFAVRARSTAAPIAWPTDGC